MSEPTQKINFRKFLGDVPDNSGLMSSTVVFWSIFNYLDHTTSSFAPAIFMVGDTTLCQPLNDVSKEQAKRIKLQHALCSMGRLTCGHPYGSEDHIPNSNQALRKTLETQRNDARPQTKVFRCQIPINAGSQVHVNTNKPSTSSARQIQYYNVLVAFLGSCFAGHGSYERAPFCAVTLFKRLFCSTNLPLKIPSFDALFRNLATSLRGEEERYLAGFSPAERELLKSEPPCEVIVGAVGPVDLPKDFFGPEDPKETIQSLAANIQVPKRVLGLRRSVRIQKQQRDHHHTPSPVPSGSSKIDNVSSQKAERKTAAANERRAAFVSVRPNTDVNDVGAYKLIHLEAPFAVGKFADEAKSNLATKQQITLTGRDEHAVALGVIKNICTEALNFAYATQQEVLQGANHQVEAIGNRFRGFIARSDKQGLELDELDGAFVKLTNDDWYTPLSFATVLRSLRRAINRPFFALFRQCRHAFASNCYPAKKQF